MSTQYVLHLDDIGRTVLQCHDLASRIIPAGRVKEDEGKARGEYRALAGYLLVDYLGMVQSQRLEVMTCNVTEVRLTLHIDGPGEQGSQITEVDAEPTREVDERFRCQSPLLQQPLHQHPLVACRLLTGTLFQTDAGRIVQSLGRGPAWKFPACQLPSLYLLQAPQGIHALRHLLQGQLAHIVLTVPQNKGFIACLDSIVLLHVGKVTKNPP